MIFRSKTTFAAWRQWSFLLLGVSCLGAHSALGQVTHYTVTPVTIVPGMSTGAHTLWGDPLTGATSTSSSPGTPSLELEYGASAHEIIAPASGFQYALFSGTVLNMLSAGATIDSSLTWSSGSTSPSLDNPGWTTGNSPWATGADGTTGYVAIRASLGGGNYDYGWAELTYNDASQSVVLDDFAYDATPNESIEAGQTSAVPEPSTYALIAGLLALGFAGWKSRRSNQLVSAIS